MNSLTSIVTSTVASWIVITAIHLVDAQDAKIASDATGGTYRGKVKLKTPRSGKDKRMGAELDILHASVFVPRGVKVIRGVILNPYYEDTVKQTHWRAAVAHWGFVLVGTNLFGVKQAEQGETVLATLRMLAEATKHPELANAPLCVHGMSIGGGQSALIAAAIPERVIAAAPVCLEVGPRNPGSRGLPMITIFGEKDGKQMALLMPKLLDERAEGAQWAIAPQWGQKHEWRRANNLVMPFYDRVIQARYPKETDPSAGLVKLLPLAEKSGWIGDQTTWKNPAATIAAGTDRKLCWLPDSYTAAVWQSFVAYQSPLKIASPAGMGDGQAFVLHPPGKAIEVKVSVKAGLKPKQIEIFNGDRPLGRVAADSPTATIPNPERGIYALIAVATMPDGSRLVSPPNTIIVGRE